MRREESEIIPIFIICGLLMACIIINAVHDTEHIYWTAYNKPEAIDEAIEKLVCSDIDSLIVTHPDNAGIKGYIYFKAIDESIEKLVHGSIDNPIITHPDSARLRYIYLGTSGE